MSSFDINGFRRGMPSGGAGLAPADAVITEPSSWAGAIGESFKGMLFGLLMVPVVSLFLFLSEGGAIEMADALDQGRAAVREASATTVDPALEARLVHVTGPVTTGAPITDSLGVTVSGLQLARSVEMFQWREERRTETVNGEKRTEIRYAKVWDGTAIDSSRFRPDATGPRRNPPMPLRSERLSAPDPKLGPYRLTPAVLAALPEGPALAPTPAILAAVEGALGRNATILNGAVLVGEAPSEPAIGDLRIRYTLSAPATVTAVAGQFSGTLAPHKALNGQAVAILRPGAHSADAMFATAKAENDGQRWLFRAASLAFIFTGFFLIFRPLSALASVIPFLGGIVAAGTAVIAGALALAAVLLVIALAWLWYAPVFSILLIGGAVAALLGLRMLAARRGEGTAPAAVG